MQGEASEFCTLFQVSKPCISFEGSHLSIGRLHYTSLFFKADYGFDISSILFEGHKLTVLKLFLPNIRAARDFVLGNNTV